MQQCEDELAELAGQDNSNENKQRRRELLRRIQASGSSKACTYKDVTRGRTGVAKVGGKRAEA